MNEMPSSRPLKNEPPAAQDATSVAVDLAHKRLGPMASVAEIQRDAHDLAELFQNNPQELKKALEELGQQSN